MAQQQTASGRPHTAQSASVLAEGYRNFVASADVAPQRQDAYEYAELAPKGTRLAIPCPSGGGLHQADGQLIPIAPNDWVVENPDGTMSSIDAAEVADNWEFVDGPEAFRDAFEATRAYVAEARKPPRHNPEIKVVNNRPMPHPDGALAAQEFEQRRSAEDIQAAYRQQAEQARQQLATVVKVARKRGLVDDDEAKDWLDLGVQPEHVEVRFDQVLGTYQVARTTPEKDGPAPGDEAAESEGEAPADEPKPKA